MPVLVKKTGVWVQKQREPAAAYQGHSTGLQLQDEKEEKMDWEIEWSKWKSKKKVIGIRVRV